MDAMNFKIEDYTVIPEPEDEYKDYMKVKIEYILNKPFIVEKAETVKDKNGDMVRLGIDLDGDKLLIYTSTKIIYATVDKVIKELGSFPLVPIKIVEYKYSNSSYKSYKLVSA
jgi:hypothetical protein